LSSQAIQYFVKKIKNYVNTQT